jgi:hypothetical protein
LHVRGRRVSRLTGVNECDPATGPAQDQGGGEACSTATHHDRVVIHAEVGGEAR